MWNVSGWVGCLFFRRFVFDHAGGKKTLKFRAFVV
jgi:hypothetical protein